MTSHITSTAVEALPPALLTRAELDARIIANRGKPAPAAYLALIEKYALSDAEGVVKPRPPFSWETLARVAIDLAVATLAAPTAEPALTLTKIDPGFRWDSERQQHVPNLLIEFEPVPANGPSDAKGWKQRDELAKFLAAKGHP